MRRPLSPRPAIAPRKSRTALGDTLPRYRLHWKKTGKLTSPSRYTPSPSIPPSPLCPVTLTLSKSASRSSRLASRSNGWGWAFQALVQARMPTSRSLLKKAAGPGVFAGVAFDDLG